MSSQHANEHVYTAAMQVFLQRISKNSGELHLQRATPNIEKKPQTCYNF